jgi:acyl phosphate:glycerol-3-phosphate acyltransferase
MSQTVAIILSVIAGYLLGSIPPAYIVGKIRKGIDIRTVGSRNMGAMNSFYQMGFVWGLLVLLVDLGKGAGAVWLSRIIGGVNAPSWWTIIEMVSGFMAIVGHNYPVWLKFKGGKGGATAIGAIAFFMPWVLPIGFPLFLVIMLLTKVPTISYGLAMICFPFVAWLIYHRGDYVIYSTIMIMFPFIKYIPRLFEMRRKAGNWKGVFARKSLKERL